MRACWLHAVWFTAIWDGFAAGERYDEEILEDWDDDLHLSQDEFEPDWDELASRWDAEQERNKGVVGEIYEPRKSTLRTVDRVVSSERDGGFGNSWVRLVAKRAPEAELGVKTDAPIRKLLGTCWTLHDTMYYRVCPFQNVTKGSTFEASDAVLGVWSSWKDDVTMEFTDGARCAGSTNKAKVELVCPDENEETDLYTKVVSWNNDKVCEYNFKLRTTLACSLARKQSSCTQEQADLLQAVETQVVSNFFEFTLPKILELFSVWWPSVEKWYEELDSVAMADAS